VNVDQATDSRQGGRAGGVDPDPGGEPVRRPIAVLAMQLDLPDRLLDAQLWHRLREVVEVDPNLILDDFGASAATAALAHAEILITGWGCPPINQPVLDAAPRLGAIVHAAGSVKAHITPACWERGIAVSTAAAANALPVAEYTLASILFAAKQVRALELRYRSRRAKVDMLTEYPTVGTYRRSVGIVAASRIGRRVIDLLRPFDFVVSVYDPYLTEEEAGLLGVRRVDLDTLLADNDIVTLHAPLLPNTRHMIDRAGLARMRDGATLINTARGDLIEQDALVAELASGRLNAFIDVTEPEVLPPDSALYTLPNVTLTPHVAGAWGTELYRLGAAAVDEVCRYVAGLPLAHPVGALDLARIA
jgi:phosphoglycerate dehydrogenase-like enzyme